MHIVEMGGVLEIAVDYVARGRVFRNIHEVQLRDFFGGEEEEVAHRQGFPLG